MHYTTRRNKYTESIMATTETDTKKKEKENDDENWRAKNGNVELQHIPING